MIPSLLLTKKIINSDRASFNRSIGQLPYYAYVPIQNAKPLPPRTSSIPLAIDTVSNPPSPTIKNPRLDSVHTYIHTATVLPHPAYLPASFFIHPVRHSTWVTHNLLTPSPSTRISPPNFSKKTALPTPLFPPKETHPHLVKKPLTWPKTHACSPRIPVSGEINARPHINLPQPIKSRERGEG